MTANPYQEKFSKGSRVRIASRVDLERFKSEWSFHHPLQTEQLDYADAVATVEAVGFYHGGDVLYELRNLPGYWHEACLAAA